MRTEIQTGISDNQWIEVTNLRIRPAPRACETWAPFTGKEQVILGDLSVLANGGPVQISNAAETPAAAGAVPVSATGSRPKSGDSTSTPAQASNNRLRKPRTGL